MSPHQIKLKMGMEIQKLSLKTLVQNAYRTSAQD